MRQAALREQRAGPECDAQHGVSLFRGAARLPAFILVTQHGVSRQCRVGTACCMRSDELNRAKPCHVGRHRRHRTQNKQPRPAPPRTSCDACRRGVNTHVRIHASHAYAKRSAHVYLYVVTNLYA